MEKIVVVKGDEYRAKIEEDFESDSFFSNMFIQADSILREIIDTNNEKEQAGKTDKRYSRASNNIMVFCAERGQGKTSAMLSFARYLDKGRDNASLKFDYKQKFFVLDSIDPSSLNKKESIVRVFISRLFYRFSEVVKDIPREEYSSGLFKEKREKMFELFQKCFDNIDYLNNDKKKNDCEDDLERLAQLGDSGRLRENLYDLVAGFLDFISCYQQEYKDSKPYLVIAIDDADLAVDNIFKICEDIRNYFVISNMVVLMAADMEQLTYEIQREYMVKHQELIRYADSERLVNYYRDNCGQMAVRYVEKMFPVGHRLELPKFEGTTYRKYDEMKIEYLKSGEDIFAEDSYELCYNMQHQLLKMLYDRTGIILMAQSEMLHPFLPRTLRELTHFLCFLYDMECVDFTKAYSIPENESLLKLRKNIDAVEEYFFEHWCVNHLNESYQKAFRKIRKISDDNRNRAVASIINKYCDVELSGRDLPILQEDHSTGTDSELRTAINLYYTIFYNKWFANAIGNEHEWEMVIDNSRAMLNKLSDVIGQQTVTFDSSAGSYQYNINKFNSSTDIFGGYAAKELLKDSTWLKYFCKDIKYENGQIKTLTFDMFQCIVMMLISFADVEKYDSVLIGGNNPDSSVLDVKPVEKNGVGAVYPVWEIKNILANVDVYEMVCADYKNHQDKKVKDNIYFLDECYERYFDDLEKYKDRVSYLKLEKDSPNALGEYCKLLYKTNEQLGILIFLGNPENRKNFSSSLVKWIDKYKNSLQHYFSEILKHTENFDNMYDEWIEREEPEYFLPLGIEIPAIKEFEALDKKVKNLRSLYKRVKESLEKLHNGGVTQQENIVNIITVAQQELKEL